MTSSLNGETWAGNEFRVCLKEKLSKLGKPLQSSLVISVCYTYLQFILGYVWLSTVYLKNICKKSDVFAKR